MRFGPTVFGRSPFGTALESFAVAPAIEALLKDPTLERLYLIEAFPYDPVAGEVVIRTFAHGRHPWPIFARVEGGASVRRAYAKVVETTITSEVALFGNQSGLSGGGGTSFGAVALQFASDDRDELASLRWDGRLVRILVGGRDFAYNQFRVAFEGTVAQATWDLERFQIALQTPEADLSRPMQEVTYGGVEGFTSVDGGPDLEGSPKPLAFGAPRNIAPVLVNRGRLVYQFHDRVSKAVDAVYDRAVALSKAPDPAGGAKEPSLPAGDVRRLFGLSADIFAWRAAEGPIGADGGANEYTSDTSAGGPSFEGYVVDQDVIFAGFSNGANNGTFQVVAVSTSGTVHRLRTSNGSLVTEAAAAGQTVSSDPPLVGGQYVTELPRSLFRLGGSPSGTVTTDVQGDNGGPLGYVETAGQIVRRIATLADENGSISADPVVYGPAQGVSVDLDAPLTGGIFRDADLDLPSFGQLDVDQPAPVSLYTGTASLTVGSAIDGLLTPLLLYRAFTRTGLLKVGQAQIASPVDTIEKEDVVSIERIATDLPAWRIAVAYARAWTVQGPDDVAAGASDAQKDFVAQAFRTVVDEDVSIRNAHPRAREVRQETALDDAGDAQSEAGRQRALVGVYRDAYRVEATRRSLAISGGQTVTLKHPRFGLSAGRDMLVLSVAEDVDPERESTTLVLWG